MHLKLEIKGMNPIHPAMHDSQMCVPQIMGGLAPLCGNLWLSLGVSKQSFA